jgi:hypothetical protein
MPNTVSVNLTVLKIKNRRISHAPLSHDSRNFGLIKFCIRACGSLVSPRMLNAVYDGVTVLKNKEFILGFEFRPLGHPARSQSLYRLSYPGSLFSGSWSRNSLPLMKPENKLPWSQVLREVIKNLELRRRARLTYSLWTMELVGWLEAYPSLIRIQGHRMHCHPCIINHQATVCWSRDVKS